MDEARRHRILIGVAVAMTLWVAAHSRFWSGTYDAATHVGADYAALRTERAFAGVPIGTIAGRLDEILPRDVPVALAPGLIKDDGLTQRLCEGLYPRRVDHKAPDVLTLARDGSVRTPLPDPSHPVTTEPPEVESFAFDLAGLLVAMGALVGFGALVVGVVPRLRSQDSATAGAGTVLLAGSAVVGAVVYLATLSQIPIAWWALRLLGWACLAFVAIRSKTWREPRRVLEAFRIAPEAWVVAAVVALVFFRMSVLPVTGWDGRSIWLFHSKRIFFQGMQSLGELRHAEWEWSHPVYPFFVPGLMAFFGGAGQVFNERVASLAVPVVWGAALLVYAGVVREVAGRAIGVILTLLVFFATQGLVGELYMDGLVAMLVALLFLTRAKADWLPASLLVAFLLSLVKIEGTIAAAVVLVVTGITGPRAMRGGPRVAGLMLTPFLLPIVHRAWLSYHHVTEFQANVGIASFAAQLPGRLPIVLGSLPQLLVARMEGQQAETQAMLRVGFAGLLVGLVVLVGRFAPNAVRWRLLGSGVALVLVAVAAVCAMPQDAAWLVRWTLDRLLLHPAVLFAMLPFVSLDLR